MFSQWFNISKCESERTASFTAHSNSCANCVLFAVEYLNHTYHTYPHRFDRSSICTVHPNPKHKNQAAFIRACACVCFLHAIIASICAILQPHGFCLARTNPTLAPPQQSRQKTAANSSRNCSAPAPPSAPVPPRSRC